MKVATEKTPDQIRRETVPVKHNGLIYGFLGGLAGAVVWFGGWSLLHQEQVRRYPEYCKHAIKASMSGASLFGPPRHEAGMSAEQLRYALLRYGNLDHHIYDAEIIRHGWYPKNASPKSWVFYYGAVKPIYSDPPALVFKWPLTLTLLTFLAAMIWGLVSDYRYRSAIIAGIPFEGSLVAHGRRIQPAHERRRHEIRREALEGPLNDVWTRSLVIHSNSAGQRSLASVPHGRYGHRENYR